MRGKLLLDRGNEFVIWYELWAKLEVIAAAHSESDTSSIVEYDAYLPPGQSAAACQGMVAAVPEHQEGGLQKRRRRCCLVFPIALLQGHWVVLEAQEQNIPCKLKV